MSKFYTSGVAFDDLHTVLRIYRRAGRTQEEALAFFTAEANREIVRQQYEKLAPITAKEALAFPNAEQRMAAMRVIPADELVQETGAILIDKQTVQKKQVRWTADLRPYEHSYSDTYALYCISTEKLGLATNRWTKPAIYLVKCSCTTTGRVYYLYVHEDAARAKDAIAAIAWTYRYNGVPLTKEQYLNLIYTET